MKRYRLTSKQFLPITIQQGWDFFSSPNNLSVITPPKLNFRILSISGGEKMHEGQIIKYRITVFPLIRMYWETEITAVIEPGCFTDIQRKGPYSYWSHKHIFNEVEGGIEMTDELEYAVSPGLLGRLANFIFVGREVKRIFAHRFHALNKRFNKTT